MEIWYNLLDQANEYLNTDKAIPLELIEEIKGCISSKEIIALSQLNTRAGNIEYNAKKIARYIKFVSAFGVKLIVFPELSLVGYPLEDTINRHYVIGNECIKWLEELSKFTQNTTALVGFLEPINGLGGKYFNSVAILSGGTFVGFIRKSIIKSDFDFNDSKYIESFLENNVIKKTSLGKIDVNNDDILDLDYDILIGDDFFFEKKLFDLKKDSRFVINIASSVSYNTQKLLLDNSVSLFAKKSNKAVLQVNTVGANAGYSFDGCSSVYDSQGNLVARAKTFEEDLLFVDLKEMNGRISDLPKDYVSNIAKNSFSLDYSSDMERIYYTLIHGVRDYFEKCGLKRSVLGLSGGLDSTICAVILADALGKENVLGISMPSHITTVESKSDAENLAINLGINFIEESIKPMIDVTTECTNYIFEKVEKSWGKYWDSSSSMFTNRVSNPPVSFTPDNIQARSRAMYLWSVSNEFSSCIPIATSDKSELYMGYATVNGDMSGGFAPIADVTKTKLFALARWMNKNRNEKNAIPESIILKRPGAELAIDPKTGKPLIAEDALMPYEFLDEIIWRVENLNQGYSDLLKVSFIYEKEHNVSQEQKKEWLIKFYKRMSTALYKWSILPPSIILEKNTINKNIYKQPITSSRIDYLGKEAFEMFNILESV